MTEAQPPSLLRRSIASVVLIALALVVGTSGFKALAALRKESARSPGSTPPPLVRVAVAAREDYTEILRGYGRAHALHATDVAAEVAGSVEWVSDVLEPGAAIEFDADPATNGPRSAKEKPDAGPVLVRIERSDLEDLIARAVAEREAIEADIRRREDLALSWRARLEVTEEELEVAEREYARILGLVRSKRLTESDADAERFKVALRKRALLETQSAIAENDEALTGSRAQLQARATDEKLARRNLERASVRAPFPGRIEARLVNRNDRVQIGTPLFRIVDLSQVEIPIALPARRFDEVAPGAAAVVRNAEDGTELWRGMVARIAPDIDERERTFFAYVVVPGTPTRNPVPPGGYVVAEITGRTHADVVVVPRQAFQGSSVFVGRKRRTENPAVPRYFAPEREAELVVEAREPVIRRLLAGVALVEAGLEDGELYLLTNLESVAHGSVVRAELDGE